MTDKNNTGINKSLERHLALLDYFLGDNVTLGIRELARKSDSSPATIYRAVTTFCQAGYLEKDSDNDKYKLGPKFLLMADAYAANNPIQEVARQVFSQYLDQFEHNFYLGKLLGDRFVYLTVVEGQGPIFISLSSGLSIKLYNTAMGKAILAFQDETFINDYIQKTELKAFTKNTITDKDVLREELHKTRQRGYAINIGERYDEVSAVAFPIFSNGNTVKFAVSLTYPQHYVDNQKLNLNHVIKICRQITQEISLKIPK